jgi:hypothetical protein
MPNAFKQKQYQAKRDKLLADCKATIARGGAVSRHRAVEAYAKQAGVTKEQAARALGLR